MKRTWRMAAGLAASSFFGSSCCPVSAFAQVRPALTQNVDEPGRNVLLLRADVSTGNSATFSVPAGKRYVIDLYTGDCGVPNTVSLIDVELVAQVGGTLGFFSTAPHYSEHVGFGLARYTATGSGPIYADAGTQVILVAQASSGQPSDFRGCSFVLSGHTINNP